jgi:dipeptidyl aminopeptidase/acylaminoacyl peptidase
MKLSALLVVLFLVPVTSVAGDVQPFQRTDVFELEWVSDPQISPDGKRVVYVRNSMDVMTDSRIGRLWLVNADGNGNVPLTGRDLSESNPAWSPDGTRIAFTSTTDNGTELFVYWLAEGRAARLTQLDKSPRDLRWSPDGNHIAFSKLVPGEPVVLVTPPPKPEEAEWAEPPRVTTRLKYERDGAGYIEPGHNQYFVVPAIGGTPRQVSSGNFKHTGAPEWTPDGKRLIFSGNRNENWELDYRNSEIYSVDIETGTAVALTERNGPDSAPVVSPDGRQIAYLGYADKVQTYQVTRLHVMNADGGNKRELLADFDRDVADIVWTGDGIWFTYDDRGDTKIALVNLDGSYRDVATNLGGTTIGRPYGGGSFSVAEAGRVAYTHVTPYRPADLAITDRRGSRHTVITEVNSDVLDWRELGQVEEVWYKSSVDQRDIQGWIVKPPGYDPEKVWPLIVENHGGPVSNYGPRFSPEIQLYAAAGYLVFYPNPRGSTSYGEEFGNLLYNNYPGDDYHDVMDGVDALIKAGVAHEDRLYVTGGSAGGIMTAWIVGKNSRFRAAAVVKPVMNWISKTLTADNYFNYANYRFEGQPWENIEGYMRLSPVSLVGNIETPTLVMVGTSDLRTPLSESKQLYSALKIRGIDTALVEVPGAPHNISGTPSQLITKIDHILAWFAKYPPE